MQRRLQERDDLVERQVVVPPGQLPTIEKLPPKERGKYLRGEH
ncbi:MAG: hypothetical protein WEE89_19300 [Gemmatimonadota bacterium]